jgi:hypothetical protein
MQKNVGCVPLPTGRQANAPFKGVIGDPALQLFSNMFLHQFDQVLGESMDFLFILTFNHDLKEWLGPRVTDAGYSSLS